MALLPSGWLAGEHGQKPDWTHNERDDLILQASFAIFVPLPRDVDVDVDDDDDDDRDQFRSTLTNNSYTTWVLGFAGKYWGNDDDDCGQIH